MNLVTKYERHFAIISNLSVAFGALLASAQLWQNRELELRNTAIAAIAPLRSSEFTCAYRTILEYRKTDSRNGDRVINQLNYVASVYDSIAIMYIHRSLDRKIVDENISTALPEILEALKHFGFPKTSLGNIEKLSEQTHAK